MNDRCVCCSKKPFAFCCEPLLLEQQSALTPEQLMRSRYSAYALGGYGRYLLKTWFAPMAKGLSEALLSRRDQDWLGLQVLGSDKSGNQGWVEFKAKYQEGDTINEMHEKSIFILIDQQWFYIGGEVQQVADSPLLRR